MSDDDRERAYDYERLAIENLIVALHPAIVKHIKAAEKRGAINAWREAADQLIDHGASDYCRRRAIALEKEE